MTARACDVEILAAFVDGELDARRHDEVAEHLAGCESCRAQVRVQRGVKAQLSALPDPLVSDSLIARLNAIAVPGTDQRRVPVPVGATAAEPVAVNEPRRRPRHALARAFGIHPHGIEMGRAGAVFGSAAASVVVVAGAALLVGGNATPQNGPTVVPSVDQYSSQHAAVLTSLPLTETLPIPTASATASISSANYTETGP